MLDARKRHFNALCEKRMHYKELNEREDEMRQKNREKKLEEITEKQKKVYEVMERNIATKEEIKYKMQFDLEKAKEKHRKEEMEKR